MIKLSVLACLITLLQGCSSSSVWKYGSAAQELETIELNGNYLYGIDWLPINSLEELPSDEDSKESGKALNDCVIELNDKNQEVSIIFPTPKSKIFGVVRIVNCMNNKNWKPKVTELIFTN